MESKTNNNMTQFETGKQYGNDLIFTVIKRTEKTITIETTAWGISRVKVRNFNPNCEEIIFKAWMVSAGEEFNADEARQKAYERAYYS
jgi:hypothetical protein